MPVSTGTATSNIDLLQKLVAWLVSRGYTNNLSQADGSGWRAHLSKGSTYLNLRASVAADSTWADNFYNSGTYNYALHLFVGSGYSAGAAFKDQPGGPVQNGTSKTVGAAAVTGAGSITSYQFIDDGDNVVVIIERTAGIFRYLCWGSLSKFGSYTGGTYFAGGSAGYYGNINTDPGNYAASCPFGANTFGNPGHSSFLRADVDGFTGKWLCCGLSTNLVTGYTGKFGTSGIQGDSNAPLPDAPNYSLAALTKLHTTLDGRAITIPITLYGQRDAGGVSALGEVPSLRMCNASEIGGASAGSDILIGVDTWRVFPGFVVKIV